MSKSATKRHSSPIFVTYIDDNCTWSHNITQYYRQSQLIFQITESMIVITLRTLLNLNICFVSVQIVHFASD